MSAEVAGASPRAALTNHMDMTGTSGRDQVIEAEARPICRRADLVSAVLADEIVIGSGMPTAR